MGDHTLEEGGVGGEGRAGGRRMSESVVDMWNEWENLLIKGKGEKQTTLERFHSIAFLQKTSNPFDLQNHLGS